LGGFRADINGLRALAVSAVLVYHVNERLLVGGYLGVDVFFVISGFLMTNIIVRRLKAGRLRLLSFYGARARRIAPALTAMCATLAIVGLFFLDPWTYEKMAADIPGALLFVSNIVLATRIGYFAPDAASQWFLHTWSLSVEFQFYLTYPILLLALWAFPRLRRRLWRILAIGCGVVFLIGVFAPHRWANSVFYLEPARSWELLAGGVCACLPPAFRPGRWRRQLFHGTGLALVGLSLWLFDGAHSWPSAWSALPVAGTALVLVGGIEAPRWARWAPVAALGRSSYSAYIWHWPILLALRYAQIPFTPLVSAAAIALCVIVGLASYWLIERWLTGWVSGLPRRLPWAVGAASILTVCGLGWSAMALHGFEAARTAGRPLAVRHALSDARQSAADWAYPGDCRAFRRLGLVDVCSVGDPAARAVVVWGDSHAEQLVARYANAPLGAGGVTFVTRGGCPPAPGIDCAEWFDQANQFIDQAGFRRIVLTAAWTHYFPAPSDDIGHVCFLEGDRCVVPRDPASYRRQAEAASRRLAALIARLRGQGRQVVIFGPNPTSAAADPARRYRQVFWTGAPAPLIPLAELSAKEGFARNMLISAADAGGATYVDPVLALCSAAGCPIVSGGRSLFKDRDHFRAAALAGPEFHYLDPWLGP
jgi:peptidoglycan/LPS O-acetylase OafA/YrhL